MRVPSLASYRCAYSTACKNVRPVISSRAHSSPDLTTYLQDSYLLGNASRRGKTVATLSSNNLSQASVNQMNTPVDVVDRAVKILTSAFNADPVYRWFLHDFPLSQHPNILPKFFRPFLIQALLNDGLLIEEGNLSSCGLIMPPGSRLENPWTILQAGLVPAIWNVGFGTLKRALYEYTGGLRSILEQSLTREEQKNHWYGVFMGTLPEHRRKGLGSSMFRHMQDRAKGDGMPLCFEAATPQNRDLYLRNGAQILGEFNVGRGEVGADGVPDKCGHGIVIWSMLWRP